MRRIKCSCLVALLFAALGCSHARYSVANLPPEFHAPHHISARHVDLSKMTRNSVPTEWLQPGDTIEVSIATGVEEGATPKWNLLVDNNGTIDVPLVGPAKVAGLTPTMAADRIRDTSIEKGIYIDPKVMVSIEEKRTFQISVVGAVNEPATYEIPASNCDLLTAITMAKGVSDEASRYIEIKHSPMTLRDLAKTSPVTGPDGVALASFQSGTPPAMVNLDLGQLESQPPGALQLYDGSVVNVMREPKRMVSVIGLVTKPGQIDMPDGEDLMLMDAIAQAGGTTLSIADKVHVIRTLPGQAAPAVIEASISDAMSGGPDNMRLAQGDIIRVEETPATIALQTIRSFFRVGFSAAVPGI